MPLMMYSLKFIIDYLRRDDPPIWEGVVIVIFFVTFSFVNILVRHVYLFYAYYFILILRKSTLSLLYEKITTLSQKSVAKATIGKIINLGSGDLSTLERTLQFLSFAIIAPCLLIVSLIQLGILI